MKTESIAKRAMLVSLSISTWTGRKLDKQATAEVNQAHSAKDTAGRYNKMLMPKVALEAVSKVASAARGYLYENTLPWKDNGERVLLSTSYFDHMQKMRDFEQQFKDEVDNFVDQYYSNRERARYELNSLFKEEDYPDVSEIRYKFSFNHRVGVLPTANDFRVEMPQDEIDKVRAELEGEMNRYAKTAMDSVWKQLSETLAHMAERLGDPQAKFHATTITNLEDLIARLPHLNLTEDNTLDTLASEIKDCLIGYTAPELKSDPTVRAAVATEADRIHKKMAGMFGQ